MRENRWNEADALKWLSSAGTDVADQQLALRVYSSRLIGADPDLVMHGGGNTSVKVRRVDLYGLRRCGCSTSCRMKIWSTSSAQT